jgi:hypothetical protein
MTLTVGSIASGNDTLLGEAITQTQEALQVRHTETGELLVEFPVPMVVEENAEAPYVATYFVQSYGSLIVLTTAVDTDWLLSEDRVFPLAIDPTVKVMSNTGGYCYVYYNNCYTSAYRYTYRYYAQIQYLPWHKYVFTSNNQLPSGATVDSIAWKQYVTSEPHAPINTADSDCVLLLPYAYVTYCFQAIESTVAPDGSWLLLVKTYLCQGRY